MKTGMVFSRVSKGAGGLLLFAFCMGALVSAQPGMESAGWMLSALLAAVALVQPPKYPFFRMFFFVVGAFISLRYILFRAFYTLWFEAPLAFVLGLLLFIAECCAVAVHFSGLFTCLNPLRRETPPLPDVLPTIDVFIPTFDEDISFASLTALACKNFDYPEHLVAVYILDDGCRLPRINDKKKQKDLLERHESLRREAEAAGAVYLTREDGEKAKAGMLNAALFGRAFSSFVLGEDGVFRAGERVRTSGELILVLDCDHVPTRDMPAKVVGHFADPRLFLAQTAHFMRNAEPALRNWGTEHGYPDESRLFYKKVQPGLDRWNAAFFCGSAAFLRRSMLEENGGLSGETVTEDCETALALHAGGLNSVYVDEPLTAGLAPESFADMIRQRRRWCRGMLQILLLRFPLTQRGLSPAQKFSYMSNCLYWLFPAARVVFLAAPLVFLLFGLHIYRASLDQVLAYTVPHLFASFLLPAVINGKLRLFLQSEILETLQSFFLLPALASVVAAPRQQVFVTTRKGLVTDKDALSPLAAPFFVLALLLLLGFAAGACTRHADPLLRDALYVAFFWNLYNMVIVLCCLGVMWERRQRRAAHRLRVAEPVSLDGRAAVLENLSTSGVAFTMISAHLTPGQHCVFSAPGFTGRVRILRADGKRAAGVFTDETDKRALVGYVYGDSGRWRQQIDTELNGEVGYSFKSVALLRAGLRAGLRAPAGAVRGALAVLPAVLCVVGAGQADVASAATAQRSLASLVQSDAFVFDSEEGELRVPFYLSSRSTIKAVRFVVEYTRSGLFPDLERPVHLVVGGRRVEGVAVSGGGRTGAYFTAPVDSLLPGERIVTLRVSQNLPEAGRKIRGRTLSEKEIRRAAESGEFWTAVDPERSYLAVDYELRPLTNEERTDFNFLFDHRVLLPKALHVVLPEVTEDSVRRAFSAVQRAAVALGKRPLHVTVSSEVADDRDCLLVGDTAETDRSGMPVGPYYALLTEADIPRVVEDRRPVLGRGEARTFRELGLPTTTFRPRSSPETAEVLIPSATHLASNRNLLIDLDVAYSAGLARGSRIEIRINDELLAWIALDNTDGVPQRRCRVTAPASLARKGLNTLQVTPRLVPASGRRWENGVGGLFASVFNTSSLTLPDTGTLARIPDLAAIAADGYPYSGDGVIFMPEPAYEIVGALLNVGGLAAQRRGAAGDKTAIIFGPRQPGARHAVTLSTDPGLPEHSLQIAGALTPGFDDSIHVSLQAKTPEELLEGAIRLWDEKTRIGLRGPGALIHYDAGDTVLLGGETGVVGDVGPAASAGVWARNHPEVFAAALAANFLLLSLVICRWRRSCGKREQRL